MIEFEKISIIENEKEALAKENILLKEKVEDLTKTVYKFTLGKKNFDMLISKQRYVFDKQGLGFKPNLKQNFLKNHFVKASNSPLILCHYYNISGHTSLDWHIRKSMSLDSNHAWINRSSSTKTR